MTKFSSKTAHLVSCLGKLQSYYTNQGEHLKANVMQDRIKSLQMGKLGALFSPLEMDTYIQAMNIGIGWDKEWLPYNAKTTVTPCDVSEPKDQILIGHKKVSPQQDYATACTTRIDFNTSSVEVKAESRPLRAQSAEVAKELNRMLLLLS